MEKNIFQAMSIPEQVSYINLRMEKGESLTDACKSVQMTKRISGKFKNHGYTLTDKQFIPSNQATQTQEVAVDTITPPKIKEVKKVQNKAKIGRPLRLLKYTKLTLEIEKELKKSFKVYCAEQDINMNECVGKMIIKLLK